jgi:tetratricopeptide (TPR) repeat protein
MLNQRSARVLVLALGCWTVGARAQADQPQSTDTAQQQAKTNDAEAAWRSAAKAHPSDPTPLANLGLLEARQGHYPQAIVLYRKAAALHPSMPGLQLNLGLAYFKDSQFKEAIQTFTPLLKNESLQSQEAQRLTFLIGMSHYGLGDYKAAATDLKQTADQDPQNLPLLLTLAHSCLMSEQYPCVVDTYHRMVLLDAKSAEADMLVGEALDEMKDLAGATNEFRAAVAANPKEPNVHFGLGYLLWKQVQYPEAAKEFEAELENTPHYAQATLYLADSYIRMDRMDLAKPLLQGLLKENPDLYMGRLDMGIVYAAAGQNEEAMHELKAATRLKPNEVNAHMRLGRLYRTIGKPAEAEKEFGIAKGLNEATNEGLSHMLKNGAEKRTDAGVSAHVP